MCTEVSELKNISEVVDKLDAQHGFQLIRSRFSLSESLYLLSQPEKDLEKDLSPQKEGTPKVVLSKVKNVCFTETMFIQAVLLFSESGLSVSSPILLAFPGVTNFSSRRSRNSGTAHWCYGQDVHSCSGQVV